MLARETELARVPVLLVFYLEGLISRDGREIKLSRVREVVNGEWLGDNLPLRSTSFIHERK